MVVLDADPCCSRDHVDLSTEVVALKHAKPVLDSACKEGGSVAAMHREFRVSQVTGRAQDTAGSSISAVAHK